MKQRSLPAAALAALAGFLLVNLLLAAPAQRLAFPPTVRLSAEAVAMAGLLLLAGSLWPRAVRTLAGLLGFLLLAVLLLKVASIAQFYSLGRPLNVALDWVLLRPVFDMAAGTFGIPLAVVFFLAAATLLAAVWWLLSMALRAIAGLAGALSRRAALVAGLVSMVAGAALSVAVWPGWTSGSVSAISNRLLYEQAFLGVRTARRQAAFVSSLGDDPLQDLADPVPALAGTDVLLVFVESYGAVALQDPEFEELIRPRLETAETELAGAGLHAVSAWLESPTVGGQSWLAHASVLSGLTIDNDAKYQALVRSDRATLVDLFERSGHRSVAVMPAITAPWPEGAALGYDRIYAAADLGYGAAPFNWVTMPDQFTLSAFERLERADPVSARQPLFAEIALISSHAPWTPIAELLDWADVDPAGMVFDEMAQRGPVPAEVWSERESIRRYYAMALDYSLETVASYAARHVGDETLLIVLGDHQPAPMVTGPDHGRAVPVHVISGNPALLAPFANAGFSNGLQPATAAVRLHMEDVRGLLVDSF